MDEDTSIQSTLQLNLLAASIFFVGLVLLAQLVIDLTRKPLGTDATGHPAVAAFGFREKAGGESYDSFTLFESDGSAYSYWRDGQTWRSRALPRYK